MSNLRIVCMDNILGIGKSVDKFLMSKNKIKSSYLMNVKRDRLHYIILSYFCRLNDTNTVKVDFSFCLCYN